VSYVTSALSAIIGGLLAWIGIALGWGLIFVALLFIPPVWRSIQSYIPFRELSFLRATAALALFVGGGIVYFRGDDAVLADGHRGGPPPSPRQLEKRSRPQEGNYVALLFAAERYDPPYANLKHPISDATKLSTVLKDRYGFSDVRLVKNPGRKELFEEFQALNKRVGDDDNVLIFYAGHGNQYWEENDEGAWIPSGATGKSDWFAKADLIRFLEPLKARHVLLLVDACFGGSIIIPAGTMRADPSESMAEHYYYSKPSVKAMTSGASEEVKDESLFMECLLAELDSNKNDLLLGQQLFTRVQSKLSTKGYQQIPQFAPVSSSRHAGGDFVFVRRPASE